MAKVEALYLTEAEVAARVGIPASDWETTAVSLERAGLPVRDPLFKNRRYWPAVRAFLDKRYNLRPDEAARGNPAVDGDERWNTTKSTPARRRA